VIASKLGRALIAPFCRFAALCSWSMVAAANHSLDTRDPQIKSEVPAAQGNSLHYNKYITEIVAKQAQIINMILLTTSALRF
jgi:hypothetical protein